MQQRVVVRVPPVPEQTEQQQRPRWQERRGPRCIQMSSLAGTMVSSPTSIDLVMRGGLRLRAKLERSCPSIDFYSGFYVKRNDDGRVCEDRDRIHARSGGECAIDQFMILIPAK